MSDPLAAFSSAPPIRQKQSAPATGGATSDDTSLNGRWNSLFRGSSSPSIDALKSRAIEGLIAREDVPSLRWIQWKLFLTEHISSIPSSWSAVFERDREAYNELRCRLLRAPDGNYPPEVGFDGTHTTLSSPVAPSSRQTRHTAQSGSVVVNDLSVNNPLSLDDSNPWKTYYTTLETRRLILQDVERTFPDLTLFRRINVQQSLTNILFLWTLQNEDVGYRQGMHELAAVLWKVRSDGAIDYRSASASDPSSIDEPFYRALADVFIEHDVYTLFWILMQSAKEWYAWQTVSKVATAAPTASTSSSSMFVRGPAALRPSEDATPPKLPIVVKCEQIMEMLRYIDPAVAQHLESLGIEPQIYCLRWIRMIFTREFALDDALAIWDGLFATGSSLSLIDNVCIAMLLRIRNQLLSGDHTSALQHLLRYPHQAQVQPSLLIKQAIFLRENSCQPSTGVAVVMQNRDLLGFAVQSTNEIPHHLSLGQSGPVSPPHRPSTQKFATVGRIVSGAAARPTPWERRRDDSLARNAGSQPARSEIRRSRPGAAAGEPLGALQGHASSGDGNGPRAFGINPSAYMPEVISDMAKVVKPPF